MTADDGVKEDTKPFSLRLFWFLDRAQSSHGIPHQDYASYHRYCTARLHRIRHAKPVRSMLTHNHKYVEGASGRRHAYCHRDVPRTVDHENVLWNVVCQAERAWATACELQQQQSLVSVTKKKSPHSNVMRRLNKALHWASQLSELAGTCCDANTVQECLAYQAWMLANKHLEQKRHADAYRSFRSAMTTLIDLAQTASTEGSPDGLAAADVWTTKAETYIRPLVRFCQYEARDELDSLELEDSASSTGASTKATSDGINITFRGKVVSLGSYKQLSVLYLKMEQELAHAQELDETRFLQLLSDLDEALHVIQSDYAHYESLPAGPAIQAKRDELLALKGYFNYKKLSVMRSHQEQLIDKLKDDAEIVHVYDTLLRNVQAMADLPSQQEGEGLNALAVEEDPYWLEAQAHVVRIRALRCFHVARLFEFVLDGTPMQVLALLKQAHKLATRAEEEVAACDLDDSDAHMQQMKGLQTKIKTMTCRMQARRYVELSSGSHSSSTNRPIWLRLNDLDAGMVMADDPPMTIPIPCKPTFYDIAWQRIGGDFSMDAVDKVLAANQSKKSGGILGWFNS